MKSGGATTRRNRRSVRTEDISTAADPQAGTVPAGSALPAGRYATHHGQRRYVLRSSGAFHLYLQVHGFLYPSILHLYIHYFTFRF